MQPPTTALLFRFVVRAFSRSYFHVSTRQKDLLVAYTRMVDDSSTNFKDRKYCAIACIWIPPKCSAPAIYAPRRRTKAKCDFMRSRWVCVQQSLAASISPCITLGCVHWHEVAANITRHAGAACKAIAPDRSCAEALELQRGAQHESHCSTKVVCAPLKQLTHYWPPYNAHN